MIGVCGSRSWQERLSAGLGLSDDCGRLLREAEEVFGRHLESPAFSGRCVEFSLALASGEAAASLRYVIDARPLQAAGVCRLLRLYLGVLGKEPSSSGSPVDALIARALAGTGEILPGGIGIDQSASGEVRAVKTYWQVADVEAFMEPLVPEEEAADFRAVRETVAVLFPEWRMKFCGFDLRPAGRGRSKLYYPQDDCDRPLRLDQVSRLGERLGLAIDPEVLAAVAFFLLRGETLLHPTGYALGFALGAEPAIKLEIVPGAHGEAAAGLDRTLALVEALGLDGHLLLRAFRTYAEANPLSREPSIDVVCLEFGGRLRPAATIYLRF